MGKQKPKYYLTASLLNAWLKGYDNFFDMLYRRETEANEAMQKGIDFENSVVNKEVNELIPIVDNALYQQFVCKECEGYMLLGFCDLIKDDTIYDLKYSKSYECDSYTESVQHLIYLYCTDMTKFIYVIGNGKDIFYEQQFRNDKKLRQVIRQFDEWLNEAGYKQIYQQNYSVYRYKQEIANYLSLMEY